ncbi:MAG TPA: cytochrome P450 [Pseudonocardia sp.]|nr:cytochrome P450 [Pseudonocardia sp.]
MIDAPTVNDVATMTDDPFGPEVLEDPLPFHQRLREAGPVVFLSRYRIYGMGRYAEVLEALRNWQGFESGAGVGLSNFRTEKPWRPPSLLLEADPPRHDAPRRVLAALLSPRRLRGLRAAWRQAAEELVDRVLAAGPEFDAVPALAEAFPLRVFPDAVGLGEEGREHLLPYGNFLFNTFGPGNHLVTDAQAEAPAHASWVNGQCRREVLREGGFGAQIWAAADRGELTPEQAPLVVRSLLSAGVDTTVHGLAAVLHALATHPDQWRRLRDEPLLARVAFDEAVRWGAPVQTFFRTATTDVRIGDTVIGDGEKILMFLGSANRDPRRWPEPDRFDLSRDPSGHVGFGFGIHQCVGQHVARLEAESLLHALAARVRTIEPAAPGRRQHNNTLSGWATLPVRVTC